MEDSEIEKLSITKNEYHALNMIEGLDSRAFHLVVAAKESENGRYLLAGPSEAFNALQSDVSDEIYYELSPKSRLKDLKRFYRRLSPDSDF
jgi:hypothetical protein